MKPLPVCRYPQSWWMPPTRGHDLKRVSLSRAISRPKMPPTRGHDLKHTPTREAGLTLDAPHTGARLETTGLGKCLF